MRLLSFSFFAAALVGLVNAASFTELAAQLPDCDVSDNLPTTFQL
jgi:hypothetical protein